MNEYRKSLLFLLIFIFTLQGIVITVANLNRPPWGDERYFVETIRHFGQDFSIDTLIHYNQMSGPLPFVLYALWGYLFGFALPALRILSVLMALGSYILFHRILYDIFQNGRIAFFAAAFLAVHPYMVGFSIFVFTDGLMILCLLSAFYAMMKNKALLFGLFAAGALLCRQYAMFFVFAAILYFLLDLLKNRKSQLFGMLLSSILAAVPMVFFFILWGGLSPDNEMRRLYMQDGLYFHPSSLALYICLLFIYMIPVIIFQWREIYGNMKIIIGCFLVAWLYWLMPVEPSTYADAIDVHTVGLFHKLLVRISSDYWFVQIVFFLSFMLGLPILALTVKDLYHRLRAASPSIELFLNLVIILFFVVMPFSYLCWEKYFMPLVPFVVIRLLLLESINRGHRDAAMPSAL